MATKIGATNESAIQRVAKETPIPNGTKETTNSKITKETASPNESKTCMLKISKETAILEVAKEVVTKGTITSSRNKKVIKIPKSTTVLFFASFTPFLLRISGLVGSFHFNLRLFYITTSVSV